MSPILGSRRPRRGELTFQTVGAKRPTGRKVGLPRLGDGTLARQHAEQHHRPLRCLDHGGGGGVYVVVEEEVLWDRKAVGRFPESKEVKRLVRDVIDPDKDLGHSDVYAVPIDDAATKITSGLENKVEECVECKEEGRRPSDGDINDDRRSTIVGVGRRDERDDGRDADIATSFSVTKNVRRKNNVSIEYSTGKDVDSSDNGLYRASYYANTLLGMTYERNAWLKRMMMMREEDGGAVGVDIIDASSREPAAVDSVSLIPNRLGDNILVRRFFPLTIENDVVLFPVEK